MSLILKVEHNHIIGYPKIHIENLRTETIDGDSEDDLNRGRYLYNIYVLKGDDFQEDLHGTYISNEYFDDHERGPEDGYIYELTYCEEYDPSLMN